MASVLSADSSHHAPLDSGPLRARDELDDGGDHLYFSRKEIEENSPSRRDGIELKKETYLRKSYCTSLQDLGMRLKVRSMDSAMEMEIEGTTEVKDLVIRPPRLEDAGLEDCALPPESIKEAFLKAASAVGSRPSFFFSDESDDESDTENVQGYVGDDDVLVRITEVEKLKGDVMVATGSDEPNKEEVCVDGLKNLKIGMKTEKRRANID